MPNNEVFNLKKLNSKHTYNCVRKGIIGRIIERLPRDRMLNRDAKILF